MKQAVFAIVASLAAAAASDCDLSCQNGFERDAACVCVPKANYCEIVTCFPGTYCNGKLGLCQLTPVVEEEAEAVDLDERDVEEKVEPEVVPVVEPVVEPVEPVEVDPATAFNQTQMETFAQNHANSTQEEIWADIQKVEEEAGINATVNETMAVIADTVDAEQYSKWVHGVFDTPASEITDYEGGWGSYVKIGIIILKIGFIIVMMIMGIVAHQKRDGCTAATPILVTYCVILVCLCILDLTMKIIAAFFVLILVANGLNFAGMIAIMRNIPTPEGHRLKKITTPYMWTMCGLYGVVICVALFWLKPVCQNGKAYPYVMNWAGFLFLINACYQFVMHYMNYTLKWEGKDAEFDGQARIEIFGNTYQDEDGQVKAMDTEKLKTVFNRMMKWYFWFQVFVCVYNVIMQILGRTVLHNSGDLACVGNGNQWVYQTIWGETFITLHIFCVITQAVLIERVYYSIPHHEGLFHGETKANDGFHSVKESLLEKVRESTFEFPIMSVKGDDDGFTNVDDEK